MIIRQRKTAAAVAAAMLFGCGGGSGEGLDETGRPLPPGGALGLAPTLASIQANVFTPTCAVAGCHGGASAQQGLRLDAGFSAGNLINVQSTQDASFTRVIPGNAASSLIVRKLEGTQPFGEQMPAFLPPLPQETIDVIRQWIQNGAIP